MDKEESWDLIIKPKPPLFHLGLKELWAYKDLILLFVKRDIVALYKQTLLGPLWLVIQPVLSTIFFTLVFGSFAKFDTKGIPYPVYTLSGLTIYNFFSSSFSKTSNVFVNNAGMFGKVYFPRLTVPVSSLISNLITFMVQFVLLFLLLFYYKLFNNYDWHVNVRGLILLPFVLILIGLMGMGFGLIASALTTKYRDLSFITGFIMQFLMYFSAVVFPISSSKPGIQLLINLNPVIHLVQLFRYGVIESLPPQPEYVLYSIGFTGVMLFSGILIFNRVEKSFMDTV